MKKYIGLVGDKQFGIIKYSLRYEDKPLEVIAPFKVTERGKNKVRISLDASSDMKMAPNIGDKKLRLDAKEFIDGWFDTNHPGITWIEPNDATKREFDIDSILED